MVVRSLDFSLSPAQAEDLCARYCTECQETEWICYIRDVSFLFV